MLFFLSFMFEIPLFCHFYSSFTFAFFFNIVTADIKFMFSTTLMTKVSETDLPVQLIDLNTSLTEMSEYKYRPGHSV